MRGAYLGIKGLDLILDCLFIILDFIKVIIVHSRVIVSGVGFNL